METPADAFRKSPVREIILPASGSTTPPACLPLAEAPVKAGSRIPVLIGGALGEPPDGGVAFVVDLTERKRAEQPLRRGTGALRCSEADLAEAQRLSHTGTWVSDGTLTTVYFSEENYRIWGFDPVQGIPSRDAMWQPPIIDSPHAERLLRFSVPTST
jgi:PAS domain-containing protein